MDFFNQGIPLGRWFRITVVIHWTFLLYAANRLLLSRDPRMPLWLTSMEMVLLFGTVLIHEFGHALSCRAMGGQALHIVLWPLGGIAFVQPPMNPMAWLVTTVCGPLVNAIFWPLFWFLTEYWVYPYHVLAGGQSSPLFYVGVACILMADINRMLLLFNLIPAYPMDGGRILQEVLWFIIGYGRSLMVAGMVGTVAGVGFIVIGLGIQDIRIPVIDFRLGEKGVPQPMLAIIGLLCAMQSFAIYRQSQQMQSWRKN